MWHVTTGADRNLLTPLHIGIYKFAISLFGLVNKVFGVSIVETAVTFDKSKGSAIILHHTNYLNSLDKAYVSRALLKAVTIPLSTTIVSNYLA